MAESDEGTTWRERVMEREASLVDLASNLVLVLLVLAAVVILVVLTGVTFG